MKTNNFVTAASNSYNTSTNNIGCGGNKLTDMTLTELQEIAIKQQQQIEINQQLLLAKEKRLKILKLEEQRNQQLTLLSQNSAAPFLNTTNGLSNTFKSAENSNKLESLKQNVLGQELKIFKLKELRNQILKHKLSNSNMSSELELIKSLFSKKERELCDAIKNVAELTKQIEQLRKIKSFSLNPSQGNSASFKTANSQQLASTGSELDKLKQELQIRNKLNEQQAKKIMQQHEAFNQKQIEVLSLDKRIDELQNRISNKKILGEQLNQSYSNCGQTGRLVRPLDEEADEDVDEQADYAENVEQAEYNDENNDCHHNQKYLAQQQHLNGSSPSKPNAKFATKQEIANTYMNKFGTETYQRYQLNSIRVLQQQQQRQQHLNSPQMQLGGNDNQQREKELLHMETTFNSSNTSTQANNQCNDSNGSRQQQHNLLNEIQMESLRNNADPSSLPSHLKHEFDKIKYLPDMVKTIKKRHSISEIEGSSHLVPPQIFQKMLEKHHKNFLDQKQQLNQIKEQEQVSPKPDQAVTAAPSETPEPKPVEKVEEPEPKDQLLVIKSTKPIIKINTENVGQGGHKRRVNFNPHALLLDAAVEGELELVVKCAKLVNDVSEPNDEGITALHNSVCAGHFDIVKFLVEFGCDINFADNDGWTPLHCAASCNNVKMVKFLIEHGASVYATTVSDNETAIKKCEEDEEGFEACFEYLNSAQENLGSEEFNNATVIALYAYEAAHDDELTFKCDDKLVVLCKHDDEEKGEDCDGWWTARSLVDNRQGLVPNNYLGLYPRVRSNAKMHQESTIC